MEEKQETNPTEKSSNDEIFPVETMLSGANRPKWKDYSTTQHSEQSQKKYEIPKHFGPGTILKKLLLPLVLLLITIITVVYVNHQQTLKIIQEDTLTHPSPIPTPTTTTSPTTNTLQTQELPNGNIKIKNLTGKFEIVVPVTYNLTGNKNNFLVSFYGPNSQEPGGPHDLVNISFKIQKLDQKTLQDQVEKTFANSKTNEGETPDYKDIKDITLGGLNGFSYSCPFLVDQECIFLSLDKINYLFILTTYQDSNNRGYKKEIDQILSTFKFIDQKNSDTSNWKTYNNKVIGYSFKYPSNWGIGSECDGDKEINLVMRLGPHLLRFPNSDCGTANIPSTVMIFYSPQPPPFKANYRIVEQETIPIESTKVHYFEYAIIDRSQEGSDSIFQFYVPLDNQYLIAQTGAYPSLTLKDDFNTILSTFHFTN